MSTPMTADDLHALLPALEALYARFHGFFRRPENVLLDSVPACDHGDQSRDRRRSPPSAHGVLPYGAGVVVGPIP
jgi:hypothetical protein